VKEPEKRPRLDDALVHAASRSLTERDRAICAGLYDHRVLTTTQLHELYFATLGRASKRLRELYQLRAIDRFRPYRKSGSNPYHYVLDELGARIVAAERGLEPAELDWKRAKALQLVTSSQLRHLVEANGFFTRLILALRYHPEATLAEWWGQRRCARAWGELVRPDGYAHLAIGGRALELWLEWDRGTETLTRVADKLDRYAELQLALERAVVVSIVAPSGGREREILRALSAAAPVRVLLTSADRHAGDPLAANWLDTGAEARLSLRELVEER
jgi:hypothetical protein